MLQYSGRPVPDAGLAPAGGMPRYRLQQWLNFITSELHKVVFIPLLDPSSGDGARNFARDKAMERFAYLNTQLEGREYLLDRFTVADAYLVTVLNWARFSGLDLAQFRAVDGYFSGCPNGRAVARALPRRFALYKEQQARRAA